MVLEAFAQAFLQVGEPWFLLSLVCGALFGLVLGIIPAIGPMVGCALFLPFAFLLRPEQALPFMVAMMSVSFTGGSITSILLNIPGDAPNAATLIDGFPMSRKGQAGRAIGAALMSSGAGGVLAVVLALGMVPLVLPLIMTIRTADMVFVILLGLALIGVLGRGSMIKGLVSGGLGLLLGCVGFQVVTGVERFTFGSLYLYDGFRLVIVALGLFAVPEMVAIAASGGAIAKTGVVAKEMQQVLEGARDVFRHWWLFLRSTIIGYIIGVIPGVGAATAAFIAYGQAKATSKHADLFGTGTIEGVIAPESANNAEVGGALLTTLALGIPGSGSMALLLAAFYMVGLVPGPEMMTKHLGLSLSLILVVAVANVLGAGICFLVAPRLAKIALIPARILVPLTMVIILAGAFAEHQVFNDIVMTLVFGILGLIIRKLGFNRPALFLGFILTPLFEVNLFIALAADGPLFFLRPISMTLILIMIGFFTYGPTKKLFQRKGVPKAA